MGVPVKRTNKHKSQSRSAQARRMSAEDYYLEGEMAYISDDLEGARAAFKRAIDAEPENAEFLDGYGAFLAECGPPDEAICILQRACEVASDHGFEKFMYLGQVLDRNDRTSEAEVSMRHGIRILRNEIATMPDEDINNNSHVDDIEVAGPTKTALQEALSSALCSLAELLMGAAAEAADDADDEDDGAAATLANSPSLVECEALLGEARELWCRSPEPLQALCSLRKLQGRDEDALALLRQSVALWHKFDASEENEGEEENMQGAEEREGIEDAEEENEEDDEDNDDIPSYEFRFECARLMLELDEDTEVAVSVLEGLIEENDSVPDVWLLLSVAYRSGGELDAAGEAAKEGVKVARRLGFPSDHEVAAALEELAGELSSKGDV